MAAHSTKLPLKHGVTIQLDDGSTIALSREVASKLNVVRSPIEYLLNVEGKSEDEAYQTVIPVDYYPAQNIRQYLKLMAKIDKREELANIRLSQLFGLLLDAMYMGNETSYTNLVDYILATVYASRNASKKVKAEIRRIYLAGPPEPKRLIQRRLAELNQTLSLKNVRSMNITTEYDWLAEINERLAVDNQGKILFFYEKDKSTEYYDETSQRREKLIRSLLGDRFKVAFRTNGVIEGEVVVIGAFTTKTGGRGLVKYLPQKIRNPLITTIGSSSSYSASWDVSPHGSRLLVIDEDHMIKIYDLADNSLLFQHDVHKDYSGDYTFRLESYKMDNWGQYLLLAYDPYNPDDPDSDEGIVIKLFTIDKTTSALGQPIGKNEPLFEILLPIWSPDKEVAVDPYRRLIYIALHPSEYSLFEVLRPNYQGGYPVSIILVINFKGQVLHRYVNSEFTQFNFYLTVRQLLTYEREYWDRRDEPWFSMAKEDLQYIESQPNYAKVGDMTPVKLPAYELWPNASATNYQLDIDGDPESDNFWMRDPTDGFKVLALVKKNTGYDNTLVSSANGDYIVTIENKIDDDYNLSVLQTVLYTDEQTKTIRNILEGKD